MDDGNSNEQTVRLPVAQTHKARDELKQAINRSHEVLHSATTAFPFTFFPDTVTVDREKLTVTKRTFFKVAETMSMRIEDILNVTADVGPFYGSIKISTRFFNANKPYVVNYLYRKDAVMLKQIIQGYIIALQQALDCKSLSTKELGKMLKDLGHGGLKEEI